ncbi:MAG: 50S ribosomal protein L29 [Candidatus Pacearchaeota archaeon]
MVKANELRNMSPKEREKKLNELRVELAKAKSSQSGGKTKEIKKMIARIKTINSSKSGGVEQK